MGIYLGCVFAFIILPALITAAVEGYKRRHHQWGGGTDFSDGNGDDPVSFWGG